MAVIAAFQLATPPDEPQAVAVIVQDLMPGDTLTYTPVVLGPLQTGGGGGSGEAATIGYAG